MSDAARIGIISEMLSRLSLPAEDAAAEQLLQYYDLLVERNRVMNLTAITEFTDVVEKHFADSLLLAQAVDLQEVSSVIDIGTGAGFPGIPLKIVYPHLQVTLLDALRKRIAFLDEAVRSLGLSGVRTVHGRAEDLGKDTAYRERYDLSVSRAVADLSVLSELCIPFVRTGGTFVSYKSAGAGEEIENAAHAVHLLGGEDPQVITVLLPQTRQERLLVCIRKSQDTPLSYPRRAGIPAKRPLQADRKISQ